MKSREAALVRDLARLLTKYSARDWQPLVRLITSDPRRLFEAIAASTDKPAEQGRAKKRRDIARTKAKLTRRKGSKLRVGKAQPKRSAKSLKITVPMNEDNLHRRLLARASIGDLQTLYLRAYNNKKIPKGRPELMASIDKYLQKLSEKDREQILAYLSNVLVDPTETYRRWVDIISKGSREE